MNNIELLCLIIFLIFVIPSVLLVICMPMYFIVKYRTISALSYKDYATTKEKRLFHLGFLGFVLSFLYGIVFAIFIF